MRGGQRFIHDPVEFNKGTSTATGNGVSLWCV
jgi:hypothetical protein